MKSNNDFDNILDKTTNGIRNEQIESSVVNQAADRVVAIFALIEGNDKRAFGTTAKPQRRRIFDCMSLVVK